MRPRGLPGSVALVLLLVPSAIAQGSECSGPSTNPSSVNFGPNAGSGELLFFGPGGCTYGVASTADWIRATIAEVQGSDTRHVAIPFTYDANPEERSRDGRINVFDYNGYAGASTYFFQGAKGSQPVGDEARLGDPGLGGGHGSGYNETPGAVGGLVLAALGVAGLLAERRRAKGR